MAKGKKSSKSGKLKPIIQQTKFNVWGEKCGFCGGTNPQPEEPHYRFECPSCGREGCDTCMPGGRGVDCPECEERANG